MDFQKQFKQHIVKQRGMDTAFTKTSILPLSFPPCPEFDDQLPYIQGISHICAGYPFSLELSALDSYCILFTEFGSGKLSYQSKQHVLEAGSLAIIDCNKGFHLETMRSPWHYHVWYLKGSPLPFLFQTIFSKTGATHIPRSGSQIPAILQKLDLTTKKEPFYPYMISKVLLNLLLEILTEATAKSNGLSKEQHLMLEIKQYLDQQYHCAITLESLESTFQMSRYKICHQFAVFYQTSPMQYLNTVRIDHAKTLLLESSLKVHEIGQKIGFESTTHFIRSFKKKTGMTPLSYRKNPPVPVHLDSFDSY